MRYCFRVLTALILFTLGFSIPAFARIDLHNHLFMKQGVPFFIGDFNGPLKTKKWSDLLRSQVNAESLDRSGLDLVVAALYANTTLTNPRESIRTQLRLASEFVAQYPNWVLAKDPFTAHRALKAGKRILILSLEGAKGVLETEEDLREFIDEGGIRIVTLLHMRHSPYGGTAFLRGPSALSTPFELLKSFVFPVRDAGGVKVKPIGLTAEGLDLAHALIQRRVWIDLAHASDASQRELIPIMRMARQPLLYTHTTLRSFLRAERAISDSQLRELGQTGGILGLVPSEKMLEGTPQWGLCKGSVTAFALQYREMARVIGELSIGMGSDFNGTISHLRPSCLFTGTSLDSDGFVHVGQAHELWTALERLGVFHPSVHGPRAHASHFIYTWSRFWH